MPAVPVVVAVTVTTLPVAVAVTPTELPLPIRLIAAARFVANCVVLTGAAPDQYEKVVPASVPFVPAIDVAQLKPLIEVVPFVNPVLPAVLAVTVTALELALAVTVAELQRLMAAARFDASVVVLLLAAKVPVDAVQAVDPFPPDVGVAHVKRVLSLVPDRLTAAPNVEAVTLTSLLNCAAVAPKPEQAVMAFAIALAFWLVLLLTLL